MFKMSEKVSEKSESKKRNYAKVEGDYLCEVVGTQLFEPGDKYDYWQFTYDLKVLAGPQNVGQEISHASKLHRRYRDSDLGGGKKFTAFQKEKADEERIQTDLAAVLGLGAKDAGKLADGQEFGGVFERVFAGKDATPIVGKRVILSVSRNKNGFMVSSFKPVSGVVSGTDGHVAVPVPPVLALSSTPADPFQAALKTHGFVVHPASADYVYNPTSNEVVSIADFKSRFGV